MKAIILKPTEAGLQQNILDLAALCGWKRVHFRPARTKYGWRTAYTGDDGFPDTVIAKVFRDGIGRLLALECKSETGQATPAQLAWLRVLNAVPGVTARIVRPSDWPLVERLLKGE